MLLKGGNADAGKKPTPELLDLRSKSERGDKLEMIMDAKRMKPENELLLLGREKTLGKVLKTWNAVGEGFRPFRLGRKRSRGRQGKQQEKVEREI